MTHDSIERERPDEQLLTCHEQPYEEDVMHDCAHVVEALETGRWISMWDTINVEKVR